MGDDAEAGGKAKRDCVILAALRLIIPSGD
jgi:hypothetical protein